MLYQPLEEMTKEEKCRQYRGLEFVLVEFDLRAPSSPSDMEDLLQRIEALALNLKMDHNCAAYYRQKYKEKQEAKA